jgi:hypothetical protein
VREKGKGKRKRWSERKVGEWEKREERERQRFKHTQKLKEGKESKKREGGNKEREGKGEEAVVACPSPPKFRFRIEEFPEVTNPFSFALADRGLGCS